jgi:hypothetical protein
MFKSTVLVASVISLAVVSSMPAYEPASRILSNEMKVRVAEEQRVKTLLTSLIQGTSEIRSDAAQVAAWRDRLLQHSDAIALTEAAGPAFIMDTCQQQRMGNIFAARLIVDVWEVVNRAANESVRPDSPGTISVSPPDETGFPPGVSPDEIHDPELRQQYLDAIAENRNMLYLHQRADEVDRAARYYANQATRVIILLANTMDEPARDNLRTRIQGAVLNNSEDLLKRFDGL